MNQLFTRNRRDTCRVLSLAVFAMTLTLTSTLSVADDPKPVMMKNGLGESMTLTMQTVPDSRDFRYCELVVDYGEPHGSDIYSSTYHGECDLEWWNNLDLDALAKELGANKVEKNGPQKWSMDEVSMMVSQTVTIGGKEMNYGATLPPGTTGIPKYTVFKPAKFQDLVYKAGKPVYQLIDPDGNVYVVQGYKVATDELATLGDKFKQLPEGWTYVVEVLEKDLVMNLTPDKTIPSFQDEFDQIYILIPE